jgi:aarF domain-containing kinase
MFLKGILGLGGVGAAYVYYESQNNPHFGRNLALWKELGPVITHYRMTEMKFKHFPVSEEEELAAYNALHQKYSTKVMTTLRDLRGFYIKVGQVMANRNDILPDIYIEKLRVLEDKVPHLLSGQDARSLLAKSLGISSVEDLFLDFNDTPIGSASIGQVHSAILKRNSKKVAIKLQGPGAEDLFRNDIGSAKDFCRVFAPEQVAIFNEIEKQFLTEFDYRREAQNLDIIGKNMSEFRRAVVVPKPYLDICTKEVLVMDFLSGPKLVDGARTKGKEYAESIGTTFEKLEADWKADIAKNGMPPPYKGPSQFQLDVYRTLVSFKDSILNTPIYLANGALTLLKFATGFQAKPFKYCKSFIPLNSSFIMSTLLAAHGKQLLVDGFFNADPHPGKPILT